MFVDKGKRIFNDLRTGKAAARFQTDVEQFREYLCDVSGHDGFSDRGRIPEKLKDLCHGMDDGIGIFRGEYISVAGGDKFIVAAGKRTVKVEPGYL